MKIWWCQEHEAGQRTGTLDTCAVALMFRVGTSESCRMVPMRLIPDNAETVERKRGANEIITEVDRLEQLVREMPQPLTHRQVIARVLLDFNEQGCPGGVFLPDDTQLLERFETVIAAWTPDFNHHAKHEFAMELLKNLNALFVREAE